MRAIEDGNVQLIQMLIQQGADVNHKCGFGVVPLLVAVRNDDIQTVNLLLSMELIQIFVLKNMQKERQY